MLRVLMVRAVLIAAVCSCSHAFVAPAPSLLPLLYPSAVSTFHQPQQQHQPTTYYHVANTPDSHQRQARHRRTTSTIAATINFNSIPVPRCRTALSAKKENSTTEDLDDDLTPNALIQWIQASPGNAVILPFLVLVGVDLLLNIAVVSKRTFESVVLGQAPNLDPWW